MVLQIQKKKTHLIRNTILTNFTGEMKFTPGTLTLENLLPSTAVLLKNFYQSLHNGRRG